MTGKRKTALKAVRPDRNRARSHAQKRGTIKQDQHRKADYDEQNGSTPPPNIQDQEKAELAGQQRLQRAEEKDQRQAAVERFAEEQRRRQEWISFAAIGDWFARQDNAVVPNEAARSGAYELLRDAVLSGEFEEDGKSQVRFLHPRHETGELSRQRTAERETEKAVSLPDALEIFSFDDVIAHYLAYCWIPRRLLHRWLTKYGLSAPIRFDPEAEFAAHGGVAKPDRLSISRPDLMSGAGAANRRKLSGRKMP